MNCVEKVLLLSSDLKLSDLVCVGDLGREVSRAQKWFPDYVPLYPWGSLVAKGRGGPFDEGWRVWGSSENPINLQPEHLATVIVPLCWKVSVAIKGLGTSVEMITWRPAKESGEFCSQRTSALASAVLRMLTGLGGWRAKREGHLFKCLSKNPLKENEKKKISIW